MTDTKQPTDLRKCEIRQAALALRATRGDEGALTEAKKIWQAMKLHREHNTPIRAALTQNGVDIAFLDK